jgi:ligand-binding sensor domain-containing protein/serine phosphatase RsbU (regulator of sigma subunit)
MLIAQQWLKPEIYTAYHGLLNPDITSLEYDSRGFIWAGTKNGLYRFDGYRFSQVGQISGKTGITGSKRITTIAVDPSNDNLWLLTDKGIECFNRETGIMTLYANQFTQSENQPLPVFKDLFTAGNQLVWILSETRLFKMSPEKKITTFPLPLEKGIQPTCLIGDKSGNLWIGSENGLLIFDTNTEKFTALFSPQSLKNAQLTHNLIRFLFIDNKENLWIGTQQGLNLFDPVDLNFDKFYPQPENENHPRNEMRSISEDPQGNLVIVTGEGMVFFNPLKGTFDKLLINLPDQQLNSLLSTVYTDQQGICWIGTRRGLLKLNRAPLEIETIVPGNKQPIDLIESDITAVAEDSEGRIWLGYRHSGVTRYNPTPGKTIHYTAGNQGKSSLSDNHIKALYISKQNNLYAISGKAIDKFNPEANRFESLFKKFGFVRPTLFDSLAINTMTEDSAGNYWIGTDRGIIHIDPENKSCRHLSSLKQNQDSLLLEEIYDLEADVSNNLWMGTNDGLVYFNFSRNHFNRFTPYDKELLNTGHKKVYSITPQGKDFFWIGTSEGCYQFDISKKTFFTPSFNPELIHTAILSTLVDRYQNLWICSDQIIMYYSPQQQTLNYFDHNDGIDNYGFNLNSAAGSISENIYLGGKNGLTIIRADSSIRIHRSPPTCISVVTILHKGEVFMQYTEVPDSIKVPFGNYTLKVEFFLPDYIRPEKNQFRYSFTGKGKPEEWFELYTTHMLFLGGLGQGEYQLKVTGSSISGVWDSLPDHLVITIEVPFLRSKTAFTAYFILVLAVIVLTFRYWARQLIRANREYKEKEKIARQIMLQKEELSSKNKSITDSINYARRIQNAMLPPVKLLKSYFPQSFLFYLPKDIVSGDFYWINKLYNKIFIAAVDCTGHGVPGAFMSIIGFELFRKITNIEGLTRPSDILNKLNEDFHEIFRDVENVVLRDGMDVAFCAIDLNDMILEFSGAFNPLYLIRDNKITEIKGDRFAIGIDETNFKDQTFKNHMIPLQEGDLIYIFSDGFADQFGGPEGKKFKYRRFRHLLLNIHQLPMEDQRNILETSLREWKGEHEQVDDVMVMGIKMGSS